eukprot:TRINITY_DN1155_c0_g1_i2.p2 TRINITY_DN1155_c0_g1~~TRINITY_DN1155_c0_g1_i2.p2  ORF type:complete len:152 (+),score=28.79 TRINITY_DN1155_c0_g1_i2:54-458(+)
MALLACLLLGLMLVDGLPSRDTDPVGPPVNLKKWVKKGRLRPSPPKPYPAETLSDAWQYCEMCGYELDHDGYCLFPDGTNCEVNNFLLGLCADQWSYCVTHGGRHIKDSKGVVFCKVNNDICAELDMVKGDCPQ